jgi:hypothetical protein
MNRLIDIGFRKVGEWKILSESINPNLSDLANSSNILYAFVFDGKALYVGKTTQTLQRRLYGYQKPGPSQVTNIKGNKLLKELLIEGKSVDIYALPDNGLHHFGAFHLNLAADHNDIRTKMEWLAKINTNRSLEQIAAYWSDSACR